MIPNPARLAKMEHAACRTLKRMDSREPFAALCPPEGWTLTRFVVHMVEEGQSVGIQSMRDHPEMWMDTIDRILRGWTAEELGALHDVGGEAYGKRLRAKGLPYLPVIRQLASTCLFVLHCDTDPGTVEEVMARMGVGPRTLRRRTLAVAGLPPSAMAGWTVQVVLDAWSRGRS